MRSMLTITAILLFSGSAFAANLTGAVLACEFSDNLFSYRDVISFRSEGEARYESLIAEKDSGLFNGFCWADFVKVDASPKGLVLEGKVDCATGLDVPFTKSVNLVTLKTSNSWHGEYSCKWEKPGAAE